MEEIKKSVSDILDILSEAKETMEAGYENLAIFYTSLKKKDIDQAYLFLLSLKESVDLVLEKLDKTVDNYELEVSKMLREEETNKE